MDNITPEQRHKNMQHIKSCNTKPEILLRNALWHLGIRYRKNYSSLAGKPDIAITRCKIAIFVDGDFWHAKNLASNQVKSHREYWLPKLKKNKMRDDEVNDILTSQGWMVLRFWESDINKDLDGCVNEILKYVPCLTNKVYYKP